MQEERRALSSLVAQSLIREALIVKVGNGSLDWPAVPSLRARKVAHALLSGVRERYGDEFRLIVGLHSHDHCMLAALLRVADGSAHIRSISNFASTDFEDDVAGLQSLLGRRSIAVNPRYDDAVRTSACNLASRSKRQTKLRQASVRGIWSQVY